MQLYGVSRSTIYKWLKEGKIEKRKIGYNSIFRMK